MLAIVELNKPVPNDFNWDYSLIEAWGIYVDQIHPQDKPELVKDAETFGEITFFEEVEA